MGSELNTTFHQVQKSERGANRVSVSRLWDIGQALDFPINYFFDDMSEVTMRASPRRVSRGIDAFNLGEEQVRDPMARWETLELVRTYYSIKTLSVRKRVADMVKSISTMLAGD